MNDPTPADPAPERDEEWWRMHYCLEDNYHLCVWCGRLLTNAELKEHHEANH